MAWIRIVEEREAQGPLREAYQKVKGKRGKVANVLKVHSLLPETMTGHLDFYLRILFAPGPLTRRQRELIALVVSATNRCPYCVQHHAEALNAYLKDRELVERIARDHTQVPLEEAEQAMLAYAVKLTRTPDRVEGSDVEALRTVGFTDETILLINLITGYFNFVNRLATGLGVSTSEEEAKGYQY